MTDREGARPVRESEPRYQRWLFLWPVQVILTGFVSFTLGWLAGSIYQMF